MNKELKAKAWAVLPNEFREEVKKIYDAVSAWEKTAEVLETLFGEYNLTSDVENPANVASKPKFKVGGIFTDSEIKPYIGPQSKHEEKRIYPTDVEYRRVTSSKTIKCDKKQALSFYEHLLDLVEKERMSKNFSEWCELEREYIALIGERHFIEHFRKVKF